jgi:hypothetical protein
VTGHDIDPGQVTEGESPEAGLAGQYEQLRAAALSGRAAALPHGLVVLTCKGMVAWIRAIAEHVRAATRPWACAASTPPAPAWALPTIATRELINILAAITLAPT